MVRHPLNFPMKPYSFATTTAAAVIALCAVCLSASRTEGAVLALYDFETTTGGAASTISSASTVSGPGYSLSTFTGGIGLQGSVPDTGAITATSTTGVGTTTNSRHLVVRVGGTDATARTEEQAAVTANDYYGFTITPDVGAPLTLTSLSFDLTRSGTFSGRVFVRSSLDGYTANLYTNDLPASSNTLAPITPIALGAAFTDVSEPVTFRIYFADDSSTRVDTDTNSGIVYRMDNVSLQGVPEPGSTLLLVLGAAGFLTRRKR